MLLKLYIYGYLNRVQSSRRLEREAGHNVEVMWLTGRLVPDHKTIADFRKDNGTAIRKVCARFIALCRTIGLLTQPSVAIDGSKFKAVNNRDRNFTRAKMERRMAQIEESVARYLQQLDTMTQRTAETLAVNSAPDRLARVSAPQRPDRRGRVHRCATRAGFQFQLAGQRCQVDGTASAVVADPFPWHCGCRSFLSGEPLAVMTSGHHLLR